MGGKRQGISLEDVDRFSIDEDQQLFWDGVPVVTMAPLSLPWLVQASIVLAGASAFAAVILDLLGKLHFFG